MRVSCPNATKLGRRAKKAALPAKPTLMRMIPFSSLLEVKIESHQIAVVNVSFARKRRDSLIDNATVLLYPGEPGSRVHDRIPAITDRPGIEIAEVAGSVWVRLFRHPNEFVFAHQDKPGIVDVMSFRESTIPGWSDRARRQRRGLISGQSVAQKNVVVSMFVKGLKIELSHVPLAIR